MWGMPQLQGVSKYKWVAMANIVANTAAPGTHPSGDCGSRPSAREFVPKGEGRGGALGHQGPVDARAIGAGVGEDDAGWRAGLPRHQLQGAVPA